MIPRLKQGISLNKLMKIGIMQPYFFPYIGYFQLIKAVDKWIIFDIAQYMRHQWVNRNRILHPASGSQYILVPKRKHQRETLIKDIVTDKTQDWKNKIIAQLAHYKKKAPFFGETINFVKECFFSERADVESLSKLNAFILEKICGVLDIEFTYEVCSEMDLKLGEIKHPGDWALKISEQLGATEYINPPGGRDIFSPDKFKEKGIKLRFLNPGSINYNQKGYKFVAGLSIIDVMMWNSGDEISDMLNKFEITA